MPPQCGTKHGSKYWLNTEPCGFICGSLTWSFLLFGNVVFNSEICFSWLGIDNVLGFLNFIVFNFFSTMALFCHLRAMLTDPGAVPKDALPIDCDEGEKDYEADINGPPFKKWCGRCKAFKPRRAHHCSMCGRCILKMDHHCPWINNCVGLANHKFFLLFVFYIFLTCFYSLFIIILWFFMCETTVEVTTTSRPDISSPSSEIISNITYKDVKCSDLSSLPLFALFESILFGLFTFCLLGDQYFLIINNINPIERLKEKKKKEKEREQELLSIKDINERNNKKEEDEFNELIGLTSSTITSSSITSSSSSSTSNPLQISSSATTSSASSVYSSSTSLLNSPSPNINKAALNSYKIIKKVLNNILYIEKNYVKNSSYSIDSYSALTLTYTEYLQHLDNYIDLKKFKDEDLEEIIETYEENDIKSNDNTKNIIKKYEKRIRTLTFNTNINEILLLKILNFNEIFYCYKKKKSLLWLLPLSSTIKNKKLKEIVYGYCLEQEKYDELLQEEDDEENDKNYKKDLDDNDNNNIRRRKDNNGNVIGIVNNNEEFDEDNKLRRELENDEEINEYSLFLKEDDSIKKSFSLSSPSNVCGNIPIPSTTFTSSSSSNSLYPPLSSSTLSSSSAYINEESHSIGKYHRTLTDDSPIFIDSFSLSSRKERSSSISIHSSLERKITSSKMKKV